MTNPYREPTGFYCTAKELLELFLVLEGEDTLKYKNVLIKEIRAIYGEMVGINSFEIVYCLFLGNKLEKFAQIVRFARDNGVVKRDWLRAIEKVFTDG